jgi:hypothetical protein
MVTLLWCPATSLDKVAQLKRNRVTPIDHVCEEKFGRPEAYAPLNPVKQGFSVDTAQQTYQRSRGVAPVANASTLGKPSNRPRLPGDLPDSLSAPIPAQLRREENSTSGHRRMLVPHASVSQLQSCMWNECLGVG